MLKINWAINLSKTINGKTKGTKSDLGYRDVIVWRDRAASNRWKEKTIALR